MSYPSLLRPLAPLGLLLAAGLLGCTGDAPRPASPTFSATATPSQVRIPAGGNAVLTVTFGRVNGFSAPIDLSLQGAPAGISSQVLQDSPDSMRLVVSASAGFAPQTLPPTSIRATGGGVVRELPLTLQVMAALPSGPLSPSGVQASGAPQTGGRFGATSTVGEPTRATTSQGGPLRHESGFQQSSSTH